MTKASLFFLIMALCVPSVWAQSEEVTTNIDANAVMQRVLGQRALKDFSLKARLFIGRDQPIPVEMLMHNTATETRTIYRAGKTELLIVQPVNGETRWFLKGQGELTNDQRLGVLAGSQFTYYDLGLPFLHWPAPKYVGDDRVRGQDCYVIEVTATNQPYSRVKLWIDEKFSALLRAEVYGTNEGLLRRMSISSFKRLGDLWLPRGIDMAYVTPNQALPSEEKSRLEVYEGNYETKLPAEVFSEDKFAPAAGH